MALTYNLFPVGYFLIFLSSCAVLYLLATAIYRLYFSPIARFPGPKLAAVTFWYEFYYDACMGGQYCFKIDELHDTYGKTLSSGMTAVANVCRADHSH
jgi:hypothetical protein